MNEENNLKKILDEEEQSLRIEELRLKVKALKRPEYKKITTWTGLVAIFVAISGIIAQGILYEIKSAKAQKNLDSALQRADSVNIEESRLIHRCDSLKTEANNLKSLIASGARTLEQISDTLAKTQSSSDGLLKNIKEDINAAAIDLRSSASSSQAKTNSTKPLDNVVEELFDPKASIRGLAYNNLMTDYSNSPDLVPSLLEYANNHMDNQNGIYNTLVVLGNIDYNKVSKDIQAIRLFAERTRSNGPKTSELAGKILARLPK